MLRKEIGWDGVDWIHLAKDREKLWAVVNTVMNLPTVENRGKLWTEKLLACQKETVLSGVR